MGLFKKIFNAVVNAGMGFAPDFSKTEYDNWLEFLSHGGTSDEWNALKRLNGWVFKIDDISVFEQHQKEVAPLSNKYYDLMNKIQRNWSILYNSKNYTGLFAVAFEKDCLDDIFYYKEIHKIDLKYGVNSPENIPAFHRLAMLYEKQGRFEEAVVVCKEAILYGMNEHSRMLRMIRKAGRSPTPEEAALNTSGTILE